MNDNNTAHLVLGLAPGATASEVRDAYSAILDEIKGGGLASVEALTRLDAARAAFRSLTDKPAKVPMTIAPSHITTDDTIDIAVAFQTFLLRDSQYTGKGHIAIRDNLIELTGRKRLSFRRRQERYQVADVRNVVRKGKVVQFALPVGKRLWRAVMTCSNEDSAEALVGWLPQTTDASLFNSQDAWHDLHQRLEELSPSTPVTWLLIALNIILYMVTASSGGWFNTNPETLLRWGGNFSPLTTGGHWWRMLTGTFLHAGFAHVAFNMYALYALGRLAERIYGWRSYLAIYLISGLAGSAGTLLNSPTVVGVGASGAIFGVIGALVGFLAIDRHFLPGKTRQKMFINFAMFATWAFWQGLSQAHIDNAAHFGGLLCGLLMGLLIGRPANTMQAVPQSSAWRGIVVFGFTLLAIVGATTAAPHLGADYQARIALQDSFRQIMEADQDTKKAFQDLATQSRSGRLTLDEAQTIVSKLSDRYDHLETHVTIQSGGNEASKIRRAELLRYIRLRRDAIELVGTGIRNNELPDAQKVRSKIEEGNRMAAALAQPVPWY